MDRDKYLRQARGFVDWLSRRLQRKRKFHGFLYKDRKTEHRWSCTGIVDAAVGVTRQNGDLGGYYWNFVCFAPSGCCWRPQSGTTLDASHRVLEALSAELKRAVCRDDDIAAFYAAHEILRWGGATEWNGNWLWENREGLAGKLRQSAHALCLEHADDESADKKVCRMNAGFSKIFSCLVDGFVMYDHRVGIALEWLAKQYRRRVHNGPKFYVPPGRKGKRDNPRHKRHVKWNLRASWIIAEVVRHERKLFEELAKIHPIAASRIVEAGLFMIGYDV